MPSTNGLKMLVRKSNPTDEGWFGLKEPRHELIKPYLDSFTLPELGSLECLRNENSAHSLNSDNPAMIANDGLSLRTQGIFHGHWLEEGEEGWPNGRLAWGLTRSNLWILAMISLVREPGYKNRGYGYERAGIVTIVTSDLRTIMAKIKQPEKIWKGLGKTIRNWAERSKSRYEQAVHLAHIAEIEEQVLELIPKEE